MNGTKKLTQSLFEALEYPLMAVPEFLAKKQIESGINKKYFFGYLERECTRLRMLSFSFRSKNEQNDDSINGEPLSSVTNGKVECVFTLDGKKTSFLTSALLSDLKFLVKEAKVFNDVNQNTTMLT